MQNWVYRANRHPKHRNRRRTSTICHSCLKWFWEVDNDVIDSKTDTASEGEVWDSCFALKILNIFWNYKQIVLKDVKKKRKRKSRNENKERKTSTINEKKCHKKTFLIWFEPMTNSFGLRVANHFTTDTHKSFVRLSIYISPMFFSIRLYTVFSLKSHTCSD